MRDVMYRVLFALAVLTGQGCGPDGTMPSSALRPVADPPTPVGSAQPALSVAGDRVILSWVEAEPNAVPALCFSVLGEGRWSEKRAVVRSDDLLVNYAEIPCVVPLDDGTLTATWAVRRAGGEDASEVRLAFSSDGGASWSTPVTPHRDGTATPHGLASVASGGKTLAVVWLDGRAGGESDYGEGGTRLYGALWDGARFGPEELIDDRVCDCCKTAVARTASGWFVAYRDRSGDDVRDVGVAVRRGGAWSSATPLGHDGWRLSACPTNGPAVAAAGDHGVVAWFTGSEGRPRVLAAFTRDGGGSFGRPIVLGETGVIGRVDTVLYPDGSAAVVWLEKRGSGEAAVVARRVSPDGAAGPAVVLADTTAGHGSGFPRAASRSADEILIAWTESKPRPQVRLAAARLPLQAPEARMIHRVVDIFLHLDRHLADLTVQYGPWIYAILFAIVFLETGVVVTPFLPGDSLLFTAGALAALGRLDVAALFLVLSVAAILGDTANYQIGKYIGPHAFTGKVRFLKRDYLDRTHAFYEKYGAKTIVIARFVPIVRTFAPFVAGIGYMSYLKFLTYNVVGGVAWVAVCVFAGYGFGNIPVIKRNFSLVILAIIFVSILPMVFEYWKARRASAGRV